MKNSIKEIKNELAHIGNRADQKEERISVIKEWNLETTQKKDLKIKKNEITLWELSASIRKSNITIIGMPEEEEGEKGIGNLFKQIVYENFPNLWKELYPQVQEANKPPTSIQKAFLQETMN